MGAVDNDCRSGVRGMNNFVGARGVPTELPLRTGFRADFICVRESRRIGEEDEITGNKAKYHT